jgi:hypothetical protein
MPLAATGAVNDAPYPNKQHELELTNYESAQAELLAGMLELEIDRAPTQHLGEMIRRVWAACAEGKLDADTAGELDQRARDRQRVGGPGPGPKNAPAAAAVAAVARCRRIYPRSKDRQASIDRRRHLAASGGLPPHLACRYTTGEQAVLKIIADDVRQRGFCDKTMSELAGRAGVCVRLAQLAVRRAEGDCLLKVCARRVSAFRNKPNVITIISAEWKLWVDKKGGCKSIQRTQHQLKKEENQSRFAAGLSVSRRRNGEGGDWGSAQRGFSRKESAKVVPGDVSCPM